MPKLLSIAVFLLLSSVMIAEDWKEWIFSPKSEQPDRKIRIENNLLTAEFHSENKKRKLGELSATRSLALQKGKEHILYAVVEAEKTGDICFVYKHHDPYKSLGLGAVKRLVPGENRIAVSFTPKECPADKTPLLMIALGRINGKVTVKEFEILPYDSNIPISLIPDEWSAEYNGEKKNIKAKKKEIDLNNLFGNKKNKTEAILTNTFFSKAYGSLRLGFSSDWWTEIYINNKRIFSNFNNPQGNGGPVTPKTNFVRLPVIRGENTLKVKVLSGSKGWRFVYGEPVPVIIPEQTENWWKKSVPLKNTVVEGSALDLSSIVPAEKKDIRIVYSPAAGGYAYENEPEIPIRMFSAEALPAQIFYARITIPTEELARKELDLWVASLKRRGYANVRMHTLDGVICIQSEKDMEVDPKAFDRVMYAFSLLKREGIRLNISVLAYGLYSNRKNFTKIFADRIPHKIGFMFLNDFECERFRFGAEKLLNTVNPYTGKRLIDDPMLVSIELYNEMEAGAEFLSSFYHFNKNREFDSLRKKIEIAWQDFLKKKGISPRAFPNISNKEFDDSSDAALFYEFFTEQLDRSFQWGEKSLREMGWKGAVILNSCSKRLGFGVSRWRSSNAVEAHGYFAHPSRFTRVGSQNYQRSSIEGFAEQFRGINSMRLYGKSFQVGEFNHAFWNRYIHEGGMVFPALAAFQGYQIISHFSNPYLPKVQRTKPTSCFDIGTNPVMMANGFLGAVLFGRGDIKRTEHQGVLNIPSDYWRKGNTAAFPINSEQSKIALMTGLSVAFPEEKTPTSNLRKPDFTLVPSNHGIVNSIEWSSNLRDVDDGSFDLAAYTAELKKRGILPADNLSDPKKGIFQSDTGEIILNAPEKKMTIITPRTEAISWERKTQEKLGNLTVLPAEGHATIAVSAVDGKNLADSSRIVLVYSTEVVNSGMELSPDWTTLYNNGKAPILVRSGECKAELQVIPGAWKLYALGLDGERLEELPLKNADGKLTISFDTAKLKDGVTPFFELIREK